MFTCPKCRRTLAHQYRGVFEVHVCPRGWCFECAIESPRIQPVAQHLTPRERYICELLAAGMTQEEIAKELHRHQSQVSRAIEKIRKKTA